MKHHDRPSLGRLIACLHRQARMYFDRALAPFGLSSGTLPLMGALLHHDGMTQQELSDHLNVDKATITRMVTGEQARNADMSALLQMPLLQERMQQRPEMSPSLVIT